MQIKLKRMELTLSSSRPPIVKMPVKEPPSPKEPAAAGIASPARWS